MNDLLATQVFLVSQLPSRQHRKAFAMLVVLGAGALALAIFPGLKLSVFAGGAANLAGLFLGIPVLRIEQGWMLPSSYESVWVSIACSGSDFWLMVAALLTWHLARRGTPIIKATPLALLCAVPLSIAVNSIRIAAVVQAHRWVIPLWPENYGSFFHQLTGVAVFLPSLILLHALLTHPRFHRSACKQ